MAGLAEAIVRDQRRGRTPAPMNANKSMLDNTARADNTVVVVSASVFSRPAIFPGHRGSLRQRRNDNVAFVGWGTFLRKKFEKLF
jgi:hypothetical protein